MAEFVYDNIVSQILWQKKEFVIEIQISFSWATAPAGLLISDKNFPHGKFSRLVEVRNPLHDERMCFLFICLEIFCRKVP